MTNWLARIEKNRAAPYFGLKTAKFCHFYKSLIFSLLYFRPLLFAGSEGPFRGFKRHFSTLKVPFLHPKGGTKRGDYRH